MHKHTLFIDMDMTLNMLWIQFMKELEKQFGILTNLGRSDLKEYRITLNIPEIPESKWFEITNTIFTTVGFWKEIPMQPDAFKVVNQLNQIYDIYILTKPWIHYKDCEREKREWIRSSLPFLNPEKIIFSPEKKFIAGDILIDDCNHYLEENIFKRTIAMEYPYNVGIKNVEYARNWNEIATLLL